MLFTTRMLEERLSSFSNPRNKIARMVKAGELIPVRRGLYETDPSTPGRYLAASIYGPSYLSFEYALAYHNLIPEEVRVFTSATCGKRKTRHYENGFGRYSYHDVPTAVFPLFVDLVRDAGRSCWLASPEKALCDQLHKLPPITSRRAMWELLLDDLRIDEDALLSLDVPSVTLLAVRYRSRSVSCLATLLERTAS